MSVFETTNYIHACIHTYRILGGFLSAYALSGDELYKHKSVELADRLLQAFETKTGIPASVVNLNEGAKKTVLHNPFNGQTYTFGDATTVNFWLCVCVCVCVRVYVRERERGEREREGERVCVCVCVCVCVFVCVCVTDDIFEHTYMY